VLKATHISFGILKKQWERNLDDSRGMHVVYFFSKQDQSGRVYVSCCETFVIFSFVGLTLTIFSVKLLKTPVNIIVETGLSREELLYKTVNVPLKSLSLVNSGFNNFPNGGAAKIGSSLHVDSIKLSTDIAHDLVFDIVFE
jgi:hypothetical protein